MPRLLGPARKRRAGEVAPDFLQGGPLRPHGFALRCELGGIVGKIAPHQFGEPPERAVEQRLFGMEREHEASLIGQGEADIGAQSNQPV